MVAITLLAIGLLGSSGPAAGAGKPIVRVIAESEFASQEKTQLGKNHVDPGCLQIWNPDGPGAFCPLKNTEVVGDIAGFGARVTVKQTFTNPSKTPVEAIYTFPLPADAAVDQMRFVLGSRVIEGQIKKRDEARRIYEAAKHAGQAAALLDQERPNVFTQSVANIMPGQNVQVEISYVQVLKYDDDWFEFNFPMVVGPRFLANTPDAGKLAPPIVAEGKRTGAGISVHVNLDAGAPIAEVNSVLHEIKTNQAGPHGMRIDLAKKNEIPNKDFILRYKIGGNGVRDALFTHADAQKGGFFTLVLLPPAKVEAKDISPKEMIFVMDQSGSQNGFPIEKSKQMMKRMLSIMRPNDTFNVLGFNTQVNALWSKSLPNVEENRKSAHAFIDSLQANGGTMLRMAIDHVLKSPPDPKRLRIIVFNTDGYVGDEFNILDTIQKNCGTTRIFTFGIGNSVNRFLIDGMSAEGRGASEIVTLATDADPAVAKFAERLNNPVLTDISVRIDGVPTADVLPNAIPDVFSETPVVIKGRYTSPGRGTVHITGKVGGEPWSRDITVNFPAQDAHGSAVASIWAREKVDDLMRSDWLGMVRAQMNPQQGTDNPKRNSVEDEIVAIGLKYGIMTQYTSFVAVESKVVNVGGKQITVHVPVEMADGVSYEGIFGDVNKMEFARKQSYATLSKGRVGGGGGGFGGASGGYPSGWYRGQPPAAGKSVATGVTHDLDEVAINGFYGNPAEFKQRFDKMSDDDIASLSGFTAEQEATLLKELTPAQKTRFYRLTRLDKKLWKATGDVSVQVWVKTWDEAFVAKLKTSGAAVHLADKTLKAIFITVKSQTLTSIAEMPSVAKILPMEG